MILINFLGWAICVPPNLYEISWNTSMVGGGTSTGGVYTVTGTMASRRSRLSGGDYVLEGGFWGEVVAVQDRERPPSRLCAMV